MTRPPLSAVVTAAALSVWPACALAQPGGDRRPTPYFFPKVEVCVIGINQYRSAGIPALSQPEAEAVAVATTFETKFGYTVSSKLLGRQATRAGILDRLSEYRKTLGVDDCLIVYFSGHGQSFVTPGKKDPRTGAEGIPTRVGYLLPYDADLSLKNTAEPAEWEAEALNMRDLVNLFEGMKARHVVVIADACCSGFLTKKGLADAPDAVAALLLDPSLTVLSSSAQAEQSVDGVYSKRLVRALEKMHDDRRAWTATDLHVAVERAVRQDQATTDRVMRPQMAKLGRGDGEFVFFPKSVPAEDVAKLNTAAAALRAKRPVADADLEAIRAALDALAKQARRRTDLTAVAAALDAPDYRYADQAAAAAEGWKARRELYETNVGLRDPLAIAALHVCAARGLGTPDMRADPQAAYRLALDACAVERKGSTGVGKYLLARCYQSGWQVSANERAAERLFAESAEQGFLLARLEVARRLLESKSPTEPEAQYIRQAAAEAMAGQIPLGFVLAGRVEELRTRPGAVADLDKAYRHYLKAYELGHPGVGHTLYLAYSGQVNGWTTVDLRLAERCLRQAAEAGDPQAQLALAKECFQYEEFSGRLGLKADEKEAVRYARTAGQQGLRDGYKIVALAYALGRGVGFDAAKAKEYSDLVTDGGKILDIPWITRLGKIMLKAIPERNRER